MLEALKQFFLNFVSNYIIFSRLLKKLKFMLNQNKEILVFCFDQSSCIF